MNRCNKCQKKISLADQMAFQCPGCKAAQCANCKLNHDCEGLKTLYVQKRKHLETVIQKESTKPSHNFETI
jgi:hypothetical protein